MLSVDLTLRARYQSMSKKIAIIGGGAAGTACAWALNRCNQDVLLFEAEDYLGGHAYTHRLEEDGQPIAVDMGVEYLNEKLSPNLFALLKHFDINTYVAPLSFRAYDVNNPTQNFWSNQHLTAGLKSSLRHEMNQFHLDMAYIFQSNNPAYKRMTLADFLAHRNYSSEFRYQALLPLLSIFSGCKAPSLDYSLTYIALSFNMHLLSFFTPTYWRKVEGGIAQYFEKIHAKLKDKIHLTTPIKAVRKLDTGIEITTYKNNQIYVDTVIFACRAEIASQLISSSNAPSKLLDEFQYVPVTSILHRDSNTLPSNTLTSEYCHFSLIDFPQNNYVGYLTRVNHHLAGHSTLKKPLYVSFDNLQYVDPAEIIEIKQWKLPQLRPTDLNKKTQIRKIQGQDNFWFCGSDYSLTGHEGAFVSGLVVANQLGADYPFADQWTAKTQFDVIKNFMGIANKREYFTEMLISLVFRLSKSLNLHRHLSARFIKDFLF